MKLITGLFIEQTEEKGNGVFTEYAIASGTVVEVSPVIVMTATERQLLDQTRLHDYIFEWLPGEEKLCCMAQGYVSVYNHATPSNCEYAMDYDSHIIRIKAIRDIEAYEELTINYNGDFDNSDPVWFDMAG